MKIVIICGPEVRHKYFANKISENFNTLKVYTHSKVKKGFKTLTKKNFKTFFMRSFKYTKRRFARAEVIHKKILFPGKRKINFVNPEIVCFVNDINSDKVIDEIKNLKPDIIPVFGAPIIGENTIKIPRFGLINLHGGISPKYKGGNSIFWALYNEEPEMIGATIHYIKKDVDAGEILSYFYPKVKPYENEEILLAKLVKGATDEFIRILKCIEKYNKKIDGKKQKKEGRLYLAKERSPIKQLQLSWKLKTGLRDKMNLPEHIKRFYKC